MRVLIVEDESLARTSLGNILAAGEFGGLLPASSSPSGEFHDNVIRPPLTRGLAKRYLESIWCSGRRCDSATTP
jgi:hypothetical protein